METQRCTICDETIGTLRSDGQTEVLCALPCSHNFGSICIIRWLQLDSTNRDCPHCRRRMVYRQCGHLIMPCHASKAPPSVEEEDMPKNCSECGDEGDKRLLEVLRWRLKKLHDEKAVLMSIKKLVLPNLTRSLACSPAETIEERMERVEREFALDVEQVWREFEDKEGRSKW